MGTLKDTPPGIPHSPVIFPRYRVLNVPEKDFELRTFENFEKLATKFIESKKSSATDFENCEHQPLIRGSGNLISKVSCTPLHIALGLGVRNVTSLENLAIKEDQKVSAAQGLSSTEMMVLLQERNKLQESILSLESEKEELDASIQIFLETISEIQANNPSAFARDSDKKFVKKDESSV